MPQSNLASNHEVNEPTCSNIPKIKLPMVTNTPPVNKPNLETLNPKSCWQMLEIHMHMRGIVI